MVSWYQNGYRHRTNGAAITWADGDQQWWINGDLHRTNGPAVIFGDGDQQWFINGKNISAHVLIWMKEYDIPSDTKWTDTQLILFRLLV